MRKMILLSFAAIAVCYSSCVAARVPTTSMRLDAAPTPDDATFGDSSKADADGTPICNHPLVRAECNDMWCKIPPGCFWMGSPDAEWGRGANTEPLVATTFTRAFAIQKHETTQAEWRAAGFRDPTGDFPNPDLVACKGDGCPVTGISYFEGLAYANALSARDGLPSCYELEGCTGKPGERLECKSFKLRDAISYDCKGYRLPMGAEWEYAARAGTRTAFYSGEIKTQLDNGTCYPDPALNPIAWWCDNSAGTTHPVGQKQANGWGIFDMIGNCAEFVVGHQRYSGYGLGPQRDPGDPVLTTETRAARGGLANTWSPLLRIAAWVTPIGWNDRADGGTVRLVRTLSAAELDGGSPIRDASPE
jgi:formylglycine-generating enzyme